MNYGSLSLQLAEAGIWPKIDAHSYAGSIHQLVGKLDNIVVPLLQPGDLDHSKCMIGSFEKHTRETLTSGRGSELECHSIYMEVRSQWDYLRKGTTEEER